MNRMPELTSSTRQRQEAIANDPYEVALTGLKTARDQAESIITRFPAATLVAAIAVGVVAGCLIKRT